MHEYWCRCSHGVHRTSGMGVTSTRRAVRQRLVARTRPLAFVANGTEERIIETSQIRTEAPTDDALALRGPSGEIAALTHWSFEQLAGIAGAPPEYLRTLPASIAAERDQLRAATAATRRASALRGSRRTVDRPRDHLSEVRASPPRRAGQHACSTSWPSTRPGTCRSDTRTASIGAERVPSGAYLGDRDMFLFLVDGNRNLDDPTDRSHAGLFRGFMLRNSDVGAAALTLDLFLFRAVCANHI